ncbi:MAG: Uncharacterized protein Athens071425_361 [Parcubacteria group bacterium Athens0714_25]|nr:MAG: Uncharacterized protein Athens071425_361 [Parcubacteria group bacterium Athens0714_25]
MSLDNLNEKINDPNTEIDNKEFFGENKGLAENNFQSSGERKWNRIASWLDDETLRIIKLFGMVLGVLFLLGAIAYGVFRYSQTAFSEDRVIVEVEGPVEINSAEIIKYKIKYKNNNRADLNNAELAISYPENFKPEGNSNFESEGENNSRIKLGKIKSKSEGSVEIQGRFYAPINYTLIIKASLKYVPSNFSSSFQSDGQKGLDVKTSAVEVSIDAPREVLSENKVEYIIAYQNTSTVSFDNLKLKVYFPDGFEIGDSSVPIFEGSGTWNIGGLAPGQKGEVKISGIIRGSRGDVKSIKAVIGQSRQDRELLVYESREAVSKIVALPLSISQTVNGQKSLNVNPGESLKYEISYRNDGDIGLRDLILTVKIDSPVLDFSKLNLGGKGSYDADKKEISWKASDFPQLAKIDPNQGETISFSIPVKEKIDVNGSGDKNFSIESVAKIDSPDVTYPAVGINESTSRAIVKMNSKVILGVGSYYNNSDIKTSGPIPPVVGQETEYVIQWTISNISNDIGDVSAIASLPTGAKWKEEIFPKDENVEYNNRTNEIVWKPGKIDAGTGVLNQSKSVSFKISVVPQVNQVGMAVALLGKTTLKAKDLFTGADIIKEFREKNSELEDDSSISSDGYKVVGEKN